MDPDEGVAFLLFAEVFGGRGRQGGGLRHQFVDAFRQRFQFLGRLPLVPHGVTERCRHLPVGEDGGGKFGAGGVVGGVRFFSAEEVGELVGSGFEDGQRPDFAEEAGREELRGARLGDEVADFAGGLGLDDGAEPHLAVELRERSGLHGPFAKGKAEGEGGNLLDAEDIQGAADVGDPFAAPHRGRAGGAEELGRDGRVELDDLRNLVQRDVRVAEAVEQPHGDGRKGGETTKGRNVDGQTKLPSNARARSVRRDRAGGIVVSCECLSRIWSG